MYRSRGFPSSLLPPNPVSDSTYDGVGILLPLLDMFNHKRRTKIEWRGTSTAIQFVNGGDKIVGEAQIFNNYGGKSNESGFPSSLLPPNPVSDSTYDGVGILLPLLDMFNHKRRTKIEWRGTSTAIQFVNGGDKIVGEAQIFNNYGGKSNESLLISYGFAIADNEDDAFLLELVIGEMRQTFAIHRSDTDDHEQFPVSLWVALASLYEDDDDGENEDENEEGIAIGIDSVELLLETLSSRLVLFENIEKSDQNKNTTSEREKYIAYYLLGQQLVLSQAVETLKEMAEQ